MLTPEEINRRKPIWLALSELWLDTELEADDLERIAKRMEQSSFSIHQLRHIYLEEVAPVLYLNLLSPAGEWVGFDEEWLCSSIVQSIHRSNTALRLAHRFAQPVMIYATERHWNKLHAIMVRGSASSAEPPAA